MSARQRDRIRLFLVGALLVAGANRANGADRLDALEAAIRDLTRTFPKRYPAGPAYLERLSAWRKRPPKLRQADQLLALRREALLANPLLGDDLLPKLLLIQRKPVGDARRPKGTGRGLGEYLGLPRQSSWQLDTLPDLCKWDNRLAVLSPVRPSGELTTVYQPPGRKLLSDIDLHWDGGKVLFSLPDAKKHLQVFEIGLDPNAPPRLRQITPSDPAGVHNFDPCYLPNGQIAFVSTAPLQGVPCNASVNVAMLYVMDADPGAPGNIRQLGFDQDHNYCPTVTNDGRILYLRWEYTDLPHVWGRYLFTMNLDGTYQREYYGSGGYWPNGIFYARPIPHHPTKVVGIVTGHHVGRVGELVIFDPARGRYSTDGVVQRIPGRGKEVRPLIQDKLTEHSWPKFLHPYPLSDPRTPRGSGKYFLVSAKPTPSDLWGIYLVDVFDNMVLLKEVEGHALLEPIPVRRRRRPPPAVQRSSPGRDDALVYIEDIYSGPGLAGVPRGAVKQLRLFTYHFVYQRMAGINHHIGVDGPWEPKRVLGTVPVRPDGSALFRVPAKTPISIQPLDASGGALQLMRSWMTAMPGELISCTGCHEKQNSAPPNRRTTATREEPSEISPWRGPVRPFSFPREVRGVLDKYCVACHNAEVPPDLRGDQGKFIVFRNRDPKERVVPATARGDLFRKYSGIYPPAFVELRRYVRVGGYESDIRLLDPCEFHANTSELVQMLDKGHHGVRLDDDAWRRLVTWIDLNAPCHGTWREAAGPAKTSKYHARRRHLRKRYAGLDDDPERYPPTDATPAKPVKPNPPARPPQPKITCPGWPFDAAEAKRRQAAAGPAERTVDLGGGVTLELVRIPAGELVMGDPGGHRDELPLARVRIAKPFWIGKFEITNEQYARFDPSHDSRYEHKGSWSFSEKHLGWPLNRPKQPVIRVSWNDATAFCHWLSRKTGPGAPRFTLPTEAQWEYACRAGTASPLSYGGIDTDFSAFANLADATIRDLAYDTDGRYTADIVPRNRRCNDRALVTAPVGTYTPNAWGLHDMHGNVWEWTLSVRRPYPYRRTDGRNATASPDPRIVRGGSWRDRPRRARSAFRLSYPPWQKVFNVGFRVGVRH